MTTRWKGSPAEVRALDAWIALNRALEAVGSQLRRPLAEAGLTPAQLALLEALYHLGPQSAGDLGRRILRSQANMTTVLDNLERDGLVRRRRDAQDRRVVLVQLTAAGRRTIERIFPDHVARVTAAFAPLSAGDQASLARICRKLGRAAATEPPDSEPPAR